MITDASLLRDYVEKRDERAFAELVHRHLDLVYSAALRRTRGHTHLAEEIGAVLSESQNAVEATRKRDAARFQAELADLERREDRLYDGRVRGLLDDDGYRRQLARLRTQRTDAAKKVETANAELDDEWLSQRSAL